VYAPAAMRKQAKYATPLLERTSMVARIIMPLRERHRAKTMWKVRSRKWSEDLATARRTRKPTALGATVQRLVLTVE